MLQTKTRSVALPEMLAARERRVQHQQMLLQQYDCPLLCFTMNIAGPVKNNTLIRRGFALGNKMLRGRLAAAGANCRCIEQIEGATGCEAFYAVHIKPQALKALAVEIEESSALGRLFDMDVLTRNGQKLERTHPRRCLICGGPAQQCARSRTHTVAELWDKTQEILTQTLAETDAKDIAQYASRSLLYEVCTTPKPGLVDRDNSGSHHDMDIFTFMSSTAALWPYFEGCARVGLATATQPAAKTFAQLRQQGKQAEVDMLAATSGVNTHKGAIFSMGIVCAALGRLPRQLWSKPEMVLEECAVMTKGLVQADFAGLTRENAKTTGQKLYLEYGITGVRGQVESGLPAVLKVGLPTLERGMEQGYSLNRSGCAALLALMSAEIDTNLIARSDCVTQQYVAQEVAALLKKTPYPDETALCAWNDAFVKKNLSPGGSADLLAICYLLYFLRHEETAV